MKENSNPVINEQASAQARPDANTPRRILVAEDDLAVRQCSTQVLTHHGYHVDAAEDGAVAWNTLQTQSYDLIITDNTMPKVTGVELVRKLHAAHMAVPVIMATGVPPLEVDLRPLRIAAILVKPFTVDELLGTVRTVLCASDRASDSLAPQANP